MGPKLYVNTTLVDLEDDRKRLRICFEEFVSRVSSSSPSPATAASLIGVRAHASEAQAQQVEPKSAAVFDNDRVYLQKYIQNPRHIEFQVANILQLVKIKKKVHQAEYLDCMHETEVADTLPVNCTRHSKQ